MIGMGREVQTMPKPYSEEWVEQNLTVEVKGFIETLVETGKITREQSKELRDLILENMEMSHGQWYLARLPVDKDRAPGGLFCLV